jgi:hypothetical protein
MITNKNEHLKKVLETNDIGKVENLSKYVKKKNEVKDALTKHFSKEKATSPIDSGSYAKGTAINKKFDIDCCIPFKKKTKDDESGFETLKEMFDEVYDYLRNTYSKDDDELDIADVRKQKVSIGMLFKLKDGDEFQLDIVPGRERPSHGDYNSENTDLSLYINPAARSKKEKEGNVKRIKTNIKKHVDLLVNLSDEKKVARLLKVWKTEKKERDGGKLIKSFVMEVYTRDAFEDNKEELPKDIWGKTKMVMNYIIDRVESVDLKDPANNSNVISDSMSDTAKTDTRRSMKRTIDEIEADDDKIKDHFPINEEYDACDEETKKAALYVARSGAIQKPWCKC